MRRTYGRSAPTATSLSRIGCDVVGLTNHQHAKREAEVAALGGEKREEKKERGHGRRAQREVLHVVGGSPELRGVPLIGTGPGGLENTRPGGELGRVDALIAEALELNEHGREIARLRMREARERMRRPTQGDHA